MVIIYENKLLVTKDEKDDFYKIPGGRPKENEAGAKTATRRLTEETGLIGIIGKKLSTKILIKNLVRDEKTRIELHHYEGKLETPPQNFDNYTHGKHQVKWLPINNIQNYEVAPNITYLIEKGDIA